MTAAREGGRRVSAADTRARLQNEKVAKDVASLWAGYAAGQRALWAIARRKGGQEVIDAARASLAGDSVALAAFGRSLLRGRSVE
jgi:hypothetical protein